VILIGQPRAVHISVSEARANLRATHLWHRLAAGLSGEARVPGSETNCAATAEEC
jgi:hypothetical protein